MMTDENNTHYHPPTGRRFSLDSTAGAKAPSASSNEEQCMKEDKEHLDGTGQPMLVVAAAT